MKKTYRNQLIIFYGSSPGAGKSTLSSFINEQLQLHGIPTRWIYEDDVLHLREFETFVKDVQRGNQALLHSLLDASAEFFEQQKERHKVVVTDSIFPCFNWLIATGFYTHDQMRDFGKQLEQMMRPLNPLVIYLDVDPNAALHRAIKQRGQKWLDDTLVGMNGYGYNRNKPLQGFDDVVAYFRMAGSLSLKWLKEWESDLLVLDAARGDTLELKKMILERLGLYAIEPPRYTEANDLLALTGTYKRKDEATKFDEQLTFEVIDGVLRVASYWPNGCELVAMENDRFRLKDTNLEIQFGQFLNGVPQEAVYSNQRESCPYSRVEQK